MEMIEAEYEWIVKNSEFRLTKTGEYVFSPIFSFEITREYQWKILFAPLGDKESDKNYVGLCLILLDDFDIEINFDIYIVNCRTKQMLRTENFEYCEFQHKDFYGFFRRINYDVVANDDIKIVCRIKTQINTEGDIPTIEATIDEMELKLSESESRLKEFDKFGNLLDSGDFSDVIIKVNEKEFKAHKCILASQSSVFKAMFSNDVKENLDNIIEIIDIDSAVMEEVLYYMYTGKVTQTNYQMKMKIFIAADKYFIDGLKTICIQQLSKNITVMNVIEIFNFVQTYDIKELHNDCIKFIGEHTSDLLKN